MLKIKTFGSRYTLSQIDRIDQGLTSLGHTVVPIVDSIVSDGRVDLTYCNDVGYLDSGLEYREKFGGKLIFNVLDVPAFVPEFESIKANLAKKLPLADKVTCISKTVGQDIKEHFNIDADTVYNPIKDVFRINSIKKQIPFFYAGRINAVNKRGHFLAEVTNHFGADSLFTVGERPNFPSYYLGVVEDKELNELFNKSKYVICPSFFEGLLLSIYEGIVCHCIPIVCDDCKVHHEFLPNDFMCAPNPWAIIDKIKEIEGNYDHYFHKVQELAPIFAAQFDKVTIARNVISSFNKISV